MTAEVPAKAVPGTRGPDAPVGEGERKRDRARSSLVWDVLQDVIAARAAQAGRGAGAELDIVDVGGGTGGFAVPFAALGHRVTVVDPSPDALAAAQRRAAEMRVTLTAVQGDAGELASLVGDGAADLVICHSVLEYVDSPAAAMAAIARVLRPGATVSVLAANTVAAVLHRALAGRYAEARQLLATEGAGEPAEGAPGVTVPRRFTLAGLTALIEDAGLRAGDAHGIRVFAGLLPGAGSGAGSAAAAASDPAAADELRALEEAAAAYPALRDIAARLHVLGHR
jgi:S-adenosylmethionine-dependent methyltransferase